MTDDDGSHSDDRPSGKGRAHTADTVPPPAGGDVYNAPTEIRQAPDDLLEIGRQFKEARAARIGGAGVVNIPPAAGVPSIATGIATGIATAVADAPAPGSEPRPAVTLDDLTPPPVVVAVAPPAAVLEPAPRPEPKPAPDLVQAPPRPTRIRQTAVAMLTILVVVTVVLVALSLAITMRGGAPAT